MLTNHISASVCVGDSSVPCVPLSLVDSDVVVVLPRTSQKQNMPFTPAPLDGRMNSCVTRRQ